MIEIRCPTPADTESLGGRLAAEIRSGDIVVLSGGLGVGKTLFTRGLATGLGVEEEVTSPSFIIAREYRSGFMPLVHVDVYRLGSFNEFDDLDVFEAAREGVLVIEWGEAVESAVGSNHLRIEFDVAEDESRTLRLVPSGDWSRRPLESLL